MVDVSSGDDRDSQQLSVHSDRHVTVATAQRLAVRMRRRSRSRDAVNEQLAIARSVAAIATRAGTRGRERPDRRWTEGPR